MATVTGKARCVICKKERSAVRCEGCLQIFCFNHLNDHRQDFNRELDEIEMNRDLFRQTLNEQINHPPKHILIKQIDQWELDSIEKIQQTAKACRETVCQQTNKHFNQMEMNLNNLTDQIRNFRQENDFNEIDLKHLKQKLTQLEKDLDQISANLSIQEDSRSFINKISVVISSGQVICTSSYIDNNTKWRQHGFTIAGGNQQGNRFHQLSRPEGIYVDDHQRCIYIADSGNHRIIEWKPGARTGQVVAGGNGAGHRTNQLILPTDVIVDQKTDSLIICDQGNGRVVRWSRRNDRTIQTIISGIDCWGITMDKNGNLYVSDHENNDVSRWEIGEKEKVGIIVAGGNKRGNQLNQLNFPTHLFVDEDYSVYVSDSHNHRVMKWMKDATEGIIVAGGQGQGNSLTQLYCPHGVMVDHLGQIYVADSGNHRIMCWSKGSRKGRIIVGGNGVGGKPNQFFSLKGLSFDGQGDLYVVDDNNHRVQKFKINLK